MKKRIFISVFFLLLISSIGYGFYFLLNAMNTVEMRFITQQVFNKELILITEAQQKKINLLNASVVQFSLDKKDRQKWLLSEANYLIRLADMHVQFDQDVETALVLLQQADKRVADLDDTQFIFLRNSLAHDIQNLMALKKFDVAGLLAKLNAMQQQIAELPLVPTRKIFQSNIEKKQTRLKETWEILQRLIIIRHWDQSLQPLLTLEQRVLLDQYVSLLIEQTKWAVLHRQPILYQQQLQQLSLAVKKYFFVDAEITKKLLTQIEAFKQIHFSSTLPPITSVVAIKKAL